jgi:hypothetical protein
VVVGFGVVGGAGSVAEVTRDDGGGAEQVVQTEIGELAGVLWSSQLCVLDPLEGTKRGCVGHPGVVVVCRSGGGHAMGGRQWSRTGKHQGEEGTRLVCEW